MIKKKKHPTNVCAYDLVLNNEKVGYCEAIYTGKSKRHWNGHATVNGVTHTLSEVFSAKRLIDELNDLFAGVEAPKAKPVAKKATVKPNQNIPSTVPRRARINVDFSNLEALQQQCIDKLAECYEKATQIFPNNMFMSLPTIDFEARGQKAGCAYLFKNHISINPVFLVEQADNNFIEDTIPHELAHLIAFNMYGHKGHGKPWKSVMIKLGYEPERCHSYDTTNAKVRHTKKARFTCGCPGKVGTIGMIRAKRHLRGERLFSCKTCREQIVII